MCSCLIRFWIDEEVYILKVWCWSNTIHKIIMERKKNVQKNSETVSDSKNILLKSVFFQKSILNKIPQVKSFLFGFKSAGNCISEHLIFKKISDPTYQCDWPSMKPRDHVFKANLLHMSLLNCLDYYGWVLKELILFGLY